MPDLSFLFGTLRGEGEGGYPTIDSFTYAEEMTFDDAGDGVLVYHERSWDPDTEESVHSEMGYLRLLDDGTVDLTLAYAFGVAEVMEGTLEGTLEGTRLDLSSVHVGVARRGEPVTELRRSVQVEGDSLSYETLMSTPSQPMSRHLKGTLRRV